MYPLHGLCTLRPLQHPPHPSDDAEMTCDALGVNAYCKGTTVKGDENKDYPAGPGNDKGLKTSRSGKAVFMLDAAPMGVPASWKDVPTSKYQQLVDMMAGGKTPGPEDICIAEGKDPKKCNELEKNKLGAAATSAPATAALALIAAAAFALRN